MNRWQRIEFQDYLRACTDAQVLGVLHKEREADREEYVELAEIECERRGLDPRPGPIECAHCGQANTRTDDCGCWERPR